jgi:6-phospho-beta-glucosidase
LTGHQLGLVAQVKEAEQAVIEAARTRSRRAALRAFGLHPLVRSLTAANRLAEHATAGWPVP